MIVQALNFSGMEADMDDAEQVLTNLCYKRYIKGYIAHGHGLLVLMKGDGAFPGFKKIPGFAAYDAAKAAKG